MNAKMPPLKKSSEASAQKPAGLPLDELDVNISPADDLWAHVNNKWSEKTNIPADRARYGAFHMLVEDAEKRVRKIVEASVDAPEASEARKVGDLFTSFMNEKHLDSLGIEPVRSELDALQAVASIHEFLKLIGAAEKSGGVSFWQAFVDNDPGDPTRYLVFFEQGGLGLPDESYYKEDNFASLREDYLKYIETMLGFAEIDDPAAKAKLVFDLETELAGHHWDNVRSRDSVATYNLKNWDEVVKLVASGNPEIDLNIWRDALSAPAGALDQLVLRQPSFIEGLGSLLSDDRLDAWIAWALFHTISGSAPYLTKEISKANFDFYGAKISGVQKQRDRWKRGVSLVEGMLGEAVGRIYVEENFPPRAVTEMQKLIANLVEAYRQSIMDLEWMSEETKSKALEKLTKFTPKIGFPVKWRDYSKLEITAEDLLKNVRHGAAFTFDREYSKIGKEIDRDEWFMTPQTVNAYYNPGFNEIVFPAAILQYPFFDPDRDAAANYGGIGAVIGHEIGHGFDDQGSLYDGDGKLESWWTDEDRSRFEERTGNLIKQYNSLSPDGAEGKTVNGALTIGENIGDLGGLSIAWKAYKLHLAAEGAEGSDAEGPEIDGYTAKQRFLISWALCWREKGRPEEVVRLLTIDPHSPPKFRSNQIAKNVDIYYEAFAVNENNEGWLNPEERVSIW